MIRRLLIVVFLLASIAGVALGVLHMDARAASGADLTVAVSADPTSLTAATGDSVDFNVTVTNHGDDPATDGYTVTAPLPAGASFDSQSSSLCSEADDTITCHQASALAVGPDVPFDIVLDITPAFADQAPTHSAPLTLTATVTGTTDPDHSNDNGSATATVDAQADLGVAVASQVAHPVAGGTAADFQVTVSNSGPSDSTGGYKLTATLPTGASLDPSSGGGCTQAPNSQDVTCDRTGGDSPTLTESGAGSSESFDIVVDTAASFADNSNHQQTLELSLSLSYVDEPQPSGTEVPTDVNDMASVTATAYAEADLGLAASVSPSGAPPSAHAVAGSATAEDYTVTVTNGGPSDATGGYKVTAPLPAGTSLDSGSDSSCSVSASTITCDRTAIGTKAPAATDVFHIKLKLDPSFADGSTHQATLTLALSLGSLGTPQPSGGTGNDSLSPSVTVYQEADLGLAASVSPSGAPPSAHAVAGSATAEDYTVTVTNGGPSDATGGYKVTAPLPAGTSLDSGSDSSCSVSASTITCDRTAIGTKAPAATDVFHIKLKLDPSFADGSTHQATLTLALSLGSLGTPQPSGGTGNDSLSPSVTVYQEADLGLAASVSPSGAPPSAHAVAGSATAEDYTVTVTNGGPSDATGGYKVTAPLPAGTSLDSGSDSSCSVSASTITCDRTAIGTKAPAATDVFHIKLKLDPSFADGSTHQATLTLALSLGSLGTPQPSGGTGNDSLSPSVTVYQEADLGLAASVSPSGAPPSAHAVAGSATAEDYTVTVTNGGPSDATGGYKVTAPLPAGTSLDSGSDSSCSVSASTITCDRTAIGTKAPAATDVFHIKLHLAAAYGDASNTDQTPLTFALSLGSLGTPQPSGSTGNDTTSSTITVYSESDLTITKTATAGPIYANTTPSQNTVIFTINVSNLGPSDAHNTSVNDVLNSNLLSGAVFCQGTSCAGGTNYNGSSISLTSFAPGSTTLRITAHANATLGHKTANTGGSPPYRGPGPQHNHNAATISASTPNHSAADSRGPTADISTEIDTAPSSPGILQPAVGGNGQAALEWSPSSSNGGQPITGYTVQACPLPSGTCLMFSFGPTPNAPPTSPTYFSEVVSGLTNGTQYQFYVYATNAVGNSDLADAGQAYASTSAFVNTIPTTGAVSADIGLNGGALTCTPVTSVNCEDIVAQYSFTDTEHVGAVYNLDTEPNVAPAGPAAQLAAPATPTPLLQCLMVGSLDPSGPGYGTVVPSADCGPSNKVIRDTYPVSLQPSPHGEQLEFDSSISTLTRGEPCTAYSVDKSGTAQCTEPDSRAYTDPYTGRPTNFCPAEFDPSNMTGWTSTKPCAFVYYLVEEIPGYDIIGTGQPIANRPVPCTASDPNCGAPAIIGSSLKDGLSQNGRLLVPPYCTKKLTVVPCVNQYQWLNGDSKKSTKYLDVLIKHTQIGDSLLGGSSG